MSIWWHECWRVAVGHVAGKPPSLGSSWRRSFGDLTGLAARVGFAGIDGYRRLRTQRGEGGGDWEESGEEGPDGGFAVEASDGGENGQGAFFVHVAFRRGRRAGCHSRRSGTGLRQIISRRRWQPVKRYSPRSLSLAGRVAFSRDEHSENA